MALKSIVKVSHLSNLSDARFCSGMGVDLLGFGAIAGTENYMPPGVFHEIRGWLAGPSIIAELYGISSVDQIQEVIKTYAPDYFELAWNEYTDFREHLTLPCIVHLPNPGQGPGADEKIAYISTDEATNCDNITNVVQPVLVRIRSLKDLQLKMRAGCFAGYVLQAPAQTKAGVTSYDELGEILEALELE